MNVFVTGATGALGRPVVQRLVQEGHRVRALSRSEAQDGVLRDAGAEPVRADLFDPASLEVAVKGVEAVLHLATRIPGLARIGRRDAWHETDRIRREGTRNLVDAATKAGVRVFVYPSVTFLYPDGGSDWLDASRTPPAPAEYMLTTLDAESEVARFAASHDGARGVTLRMAGFYGPESSQTKGMLEYARRGVAPMFGADDAFSSWLWIKDAASAVVAAMDKAPTGVYDVVEDEPMTRHELREAMARAVGRSTLWRIPDALAPLALGVLSDTGTRSQRVSNARFKAATGWTPEVKTAREGWARIASGLGAPTPGLSAWARAGLVYLAITGLMVGAWAQFAPRSFFGAFPGLGFAWVSVDGPYNEHLVRDVGGLNLSLAVLAVVALASGNRFLTRTFGLASIAYQLPHLVYHVVHVGALPSALEQVLQTLTLLLATLVPFALLFEGARPAGPNAAPTSKRLA